MRLRTCASALVLIACGTPAPRAKAPVSSRATPPATAAPAPEPLRFFAGPTNLCEGVQDRSDTAALFAKGCAGGDWEGCSRLVPFVLCGAGATRDPRRALELSGSACDHGYLPACGDGYVVLELVTDRTAADLSRALRLLETGCRGGDRHSCFNLQYAAMQRRTTADDAKLALAAMEKLCAGGDAEACGGAATLYVAGIAGIPVDYARAIRVGTAACDKGDGTACNAVGVAYRAGPAGPTSAPKAVEAFNKSCEASNASACDNLGVMYAEGAGVATDALRAEQLFRKACDAGNPPACTHLATLMSSSSAAQPIGTSNVVPVHQ